jgi:hypothetical protein
MPAAMVSKRGRRRRRCRRSIDDKQQQQQQQQKKKGERALLMAKNGSGLRSEARHRKSPPTLWRFNVPPSERGAKDEEAIMVRWTVDWMVDGWMHGWMKIGRSTHTYREILAAECIRSIDQSVVGPSARLRLDVADTHTHPVWWAGAGLASMPCSGMMIAMRYLCVCFGCACLGLPLYSYF